MYDGTCSNLKIIYVQYHFEVFNKKLWFPVGVVEGREAKGHGSPSPPVKEYMFGSFDAHHISLV